MVAKKKAFKLLVSNFRFKKKKNYNNIMRSPWTLKLATFIAYY